MAASEYSVLVKKKHQKYGHMSILGMPRYLLDFHAGKLEILYIYKKKTSPKTFGRPLITALRWATYFELSQVKSSEVRSSQIKLSQVK